MNLNQAPFVHPFEEEEQRLKVERNVRLLMLEDEHRTELYNFEATYTQNYLLLVRGSPALVERAFTDVVNKYFDEHMKRVLERTPPEDVNKTFAYLWSKYVNNVSKLCDSLLYYESSHVLKNRLKPTWKVLMDKVLELKYALFRGGNLSDAESLAELLEEIAVYYNQWKVCRVKRWTEMMCYTFEVLKIKHDQNKHRTRLTEEDAILSYYERFKKRLLRQNDLWSYLTIMQSLIDNPVVYYFCVCFKQFPLPYSAEFVDENLFNVTWASFKEAGKANEANFSDDQMSRLLHIYKQYLLVHTDLKELVTSLDKFYSDVLMDLPLTPESPGETVERINTILDHYALQKKKIKSSGLKYLEIFSTSSNNLASVVPEVIKKHGYYKLINEVVAGNNQVAAIDVTNKVIPLIFYNFGNLSDENNELQPRFTNKFISIMKNFSVYRRQEMTDDLLAQDRKDFRLTFDKIVVAMMESNQLQDEFRVLHPETRLSVSTIVEPIWPINADDRDQAILPLEAKLMFDEYHSFFKSKYEKKRLTLLPKFGRAMMVARFGVGAESREYTLSVSTFQMIILMLLNDQSVLTFDEVRTKTKMTDEFVRRSLKSLVKAKVLLVKAGNAAKKIPNKFSVNEAFRTDKAVVYADLDKEAAPVRSMNPELVPLNKHYVHAVRAYLVRTLKHAKSMPKKDLIAGAIQHFADRFKVNKKDVERLIEDLCAGKYLIVDAQNTKQINYLDQ